MCPRRVHRRAGVPRPQECLQCNVTFTPRNFWRRPRWCSHRCQTAGLRGSVWNYALITWVARHGSWDAQWRYYPRRDEAEGAAPDGEPWTVVDVARAPWIEWPSWYALTHTRPMLAPGSDQPYRNDHGERRTHL
jgi:hypothetical protein